jgi:hypothetical protein
VLPFVCFPEEAAPLCLLAINCRRRPGSYAMAPRCRLASYAMTPRAYHRCGHAVAVQRASTLEPNREADPGQWSSVSPTSRAHSSACWDGWCRTLARETADRQRRVAGRSPALGFVHGTTRAHSQTPFIESRQQQQEKQAAAKYEDRLPQWRLLLLRMWPTPPSSRANITRLLSRYDCCCPPKPISMHQRKNDVRVSPLPQPHQSGEP